MGLALGLVFGGPIAWVVVCLALWTRLDARLFLSASACGVIVSAGFSAVMWGAWFAEDHDVSKSFVAVFAMTATAGTMIAAPVHYGLKRRVLRGSAA